ncbi:hypothetical protein M2354_001212 [Leclercia adecarboxylata]|uniref:Lipoprotein n=1 Tax=Leclercia adecarboxylata TaxID=83655 RepID=A0A4V6JIJ2_9ENTR|nr:hypothetical protein [Leclercia adecarboxylata]KFC89464.1 phage protein [Leclercia adecarboxylata ATCC 23216 = NBRC 102595]MDH6161557.1 hypothetical protein [Leclercia adecarboxylata]MDU1090608.1 hypothetical protein [Leclercia adecarboxylata]PHH04096.1 hypothetical protein CRX53_08990 [Leclercia adecarboxylata]UBH69297.1 hypothetical protein LA332_08760 [Leclercia adecarboxylata]
MTFSLRTILLLAVMIMLLACGYGELRYRNGWYAHAEHINVLAADKRAKAEKAIQPVELKAAQARDEGRVIYRTITRDVVKYVQDPNRTVCDFDDESVRLRREAIDAANSISGFDAGTLQGK